MRARPGRQTTGQAGAARGRSSAHAAAARRARRRRCWSRSRHDAAVIAASARERQRGSQRRAMRFAVRRAAPEVGLDQQLAAAAEAGAVDLQVLHDPLHVIARLGDRDALDPVDRIDLRIARIAIGRDPLPHAAAAGVVAGEGQDVGAAIAVDQSTTRPRPSACCRPGRLSRRCAVIGGLELAWRCRSPPPASPASGPSRWRSRRPSG